MTQSKIKTKFRKVYGNSSNFMTPTVIRYGKQGNFLYELSKGTGFDREPIYGVTVLDLNGNKQHDLSECLHNKKDAENYIKELKNIEL